MRSLGRSHHMKNSIDESYFIELAEKNPEDVCRLSLCDYDSIEKGYRISVWGEDYRIYPNESKIIRIHEDNPDVSRLLGLFIIYYLLRSKDINVSKEWISEKDIPGGATFFRGPHKIPTHIIETRYENNIEEFKQKCERLDGIPLVSSATSLSAISWPTATATEIAMQRSPAEP